MAEQTADMKVEVVGFSADVALPGSVEVTNDAGTPLPVAVTDPAAGTQAKVTTSPAVDTDAGLVVRLPRRGTLTDRSAAIAAAGVSQQVMAANTSRRYLLIVNPLDSGETLWVNFTSDAVASRPSIPIDAGRELCMESMFVSTEKVTAIAATTGHSFVAKEG